MGQYFLGTNKSNTNKPEQLTVKEGAFTLHIETPSSFAKRVHFPWTDGINRDIGLPSTVITPEFTVFMMGEVFTEINNYVKALTTITEKVTKILFAVSPIFATSEQSYKSAMSKKTERRKSLFQDIASGTTSSNGGA